MILHEDSKSQFPKRITIRDDRRSTRLVPDLSAMEGATDAPDLFAGLAQAVVSAINADACLVSLYDLESDSLRDIAGSVAWPAKLNAVARTRPLVNAPTSRRLLEMGTSVQISAADPVIDTVERQMMEELGYGRALMCRLSAEGRPIGRVVAYRAQDRAFRQGDDRQVDVLSSFAAGVYSRIQMATKLEAHYMETIEALMSALEARDPYTEAHTGRIKNLALGLAVALQVPPELRQAVKLGSILHDVGKIGIPDAILLKPASLSDDEWDIMRTHPLIGERMLRTIDFLSPTLPIIRHHHERWDGNGYPDKLAGEDIPLGARIVAVCDSFDAMTTDRPYRKGMSADEACDELISCAGSQFDPACAALLVDVIAKMGDDNLEERFVRYAT